MNITYTPLVSQYDLSRRTYNHMAGFLLQFYGYAEFRLNKFYLSLIKISANTISGHHIHRDHTSTGMVFFATTPMNSKHLCSLE